MLTEKTEQREELITANLGLVHACANRFRSRGIEYDDLFQAGCVGLIKAADGFDSTRGFRYSTYAVPAILGEIKRLFRDGGSVKVSRSHKEKALELLKQKEKLEQKLGREPTLRELAECADMNAEDTAMLLGAVAAPISLNPENPDGEEHVLDIPAGQTQEELVSEISLHECVRRLGEPDSDIIRLRYFEGLTQAKTAQLLGMTQVQISRHEKTALAKLRRIV